MLHKPEPTAAQPCIAMDIQLLMERAYRSKQALDVPGQRHGVVQACNNAIDDLSVSLAFVPSYTPEGALATACALYGNLDFDEDKLDVFERERLRRAELMTMQLIGFIERKFGLDRLDMGLDYFCPDWAEAAHLPWTIEQGAAA